MWIIIGIAFLINPLLGVCIAVVHLISESVKKQSQAK